MNAFGAGFRKDEHGCKLDPCPEGREQNVPICSAGPKPSQYRKRVSSRCRHPLIQHGRSFGYSGRQAAPVYPRCPAEQRPDRSFRAALSSARYAGRFDRAHQSGCRVSVRQGTSRHGGSSASRHWNRKRSSGGERLRLLLCVRLPFPFLFRLHIPVLDPCHARAPCPFPRSRACPRRVRFPHPLPHRLQSTIRPP